MRMGYGAPPDHPNAAAPPGRNVQEHCAHHTPGFEGRGVGKVMQWGGETELLRSSRCRRRASPKGVPADLRIPRIRGWLGVPKCEPHRLRRAEFVRSCLHP